MTVDSGRATFRKAERLRDRTLIDRLSDRRTGQADLNYPFLFKWLDVGEADTVYPAQMLVRVPKKRLRRAVDRSLVRRLVKEAYRQNKHKWYEILRERNQVVALMIVFIGKEMCEYSAAEKAVASFIRRFAESEPHADGDA